MGDSLEDFTTETDIEDSLADAGGVAVSDEGVAPEENEPAPAQQLATEMAGLKRRTTDEVVEATVREIRDDDAPTHKLAVDIRTEYGDLDTCYFDKPRDEWSTDSRFVKWVRRNGYTAESLDRLDADNAVVPARYESADDISLVVPEPDRTRRERLSAGLEHVTNYRPAHYVTPFWLLIGVYFAVGNLGFYLLWLAGIATPEGTDGVGALVITLICSAFFGLVTALVLGMLTAYAHDKHYHD